LDINDRKAIVNYLLAFPVTIEEHIRDGIYELRTATEGNIYRLFFIFDEDKIVVLFNGFPKKTQKTPQTEIEKAIRIKAEYDEYKRRNDT